MQTYQRRANPCFTDILFFGLMIEVLFFVLIMIQSMWNQKFYFGAVSSLVAIPFFASAWVRERRFLREELAYLRELENQARALPPLPIGEVEAPLN